MLLTQKIAAYIWQSLAVVSNISDGGQKEHPAIF